MTARDARGRFVSDDTFAAERVLEAAVREAVRILRAPNPSWRLAGFVMWKAACSADLLLSERAS